MTRTEAREQAFLILFDQIFNEDSTIEEIIRSASETELIKINTFAQNLLSLWEANKEQIDTVISENLTKWKINRLPKVSLAILRLAVAEIMYVDDVPDGVSVNEAVELAKKYGETHENRADYSFINGVLGSVVKSK